MKTFEKDHNHFEDFESVLIVISNDCFGLV